MLPTNLLTEQEYQRLASKLLDSNDPENFIEQCEKTYLSANRSFYAHLEKAVQGFYQTKEEYLKSQESQIIVTLPPDPEKTLKILALVKAYAEKSATRTFDISRFQFELRNNRLEVSQEPGKVVHLVCCSETITHLQGLVPFSPDQKEFAVFEYIFSEPHKLKKGGTLAQIVDSKEKTEGVFQVIKEGLEQLTRPELKAYFFQCVERELNFERAKELTGRHTLPILNFIERIEKLKHETLNHSESTTELEASEREGNPDFTTARQVLAMHFLLDFCKIQGVDKTQIARFIEFLTGKSYHNIYRNVKNPYATKKGNFRKEDLQFIRPYFENLGLSEIVKMINNELDKPLD
jgi:hypothetical protein